jgi:hypothetical protein
LTCLNANSCEACPRTNETFRERNQDLTAVNLCECIQGYYDAEKVIC